MVSRLAGGLVLAELRGLTFRKEVGNRGGSSNIYANFSKVYIPQTQVCFS